MLDSLETFTVNGNTDHTLMVMKKKKKKYGKLILQHTTSSCAQNLLSSQYKAWAKKHNLRLGSLFEISSRSAKNLVTLKEDLEIRLHSSRPWVRLRLRTGMSPVKLFVHGKYWSRVAKHDTVILKVLLSRKVREIVVYPIAQCANLLSVPRLSLLPRPLFST
jgi:hypothetical protein